MAMITITEHICHIPANRISIPKMHIRFSNGNEADIGLTEDRGPLPPVKPGELKHNAYFKGIIPHQNDSRIYLIGCLPDKYNDKYNDQYKQYKDQYNDQYKQYTNDLGKEHDKHLDQIDLLLIKKGREVRVVRNRGRSTKSNLFINALYWLRAK